MRRVVVTGIGAITSIGSGADGLWQGIRCARSAIGPITHFDPSPFGCRIAAEVKDFDPDAYFEGKSRKRLDRCSQFAVAPARSSLPSESAFSP